MTSSCEEKEEADETRRGGGLVAEASRFLAKLFSPLNCEPPPRLYRSSGGKATHEPLAEAHTLTTTGIV